MVAVRVAWSRTARRSSSWGAGAWASSGGQQAARLEQHQPGGGLDELAGELGIEIAASRI